MFFYIAFSIIKQRKHLNAMDFFDIILREEGLYHLRDDMEELRTEILKRLDLLELKDSPEELMKAMQKLLDDHKSKLENTKKEVGEIVMDASGRRN
jgi:hypothetical protein